MLRSLFALIWVAVNSAVLNGYQFVLFLLVRPLNRRRYRELMSGYCQSTWVNMMSSILPETSMVVSGDMPHHDGKAKIIIANHQVDADWWYIWQIARLQSREGYVKIILKDSLKNVPVFGWGMQFFEFLFLRRSWESDRHRIQRLLGSFAKDEYPCWLVLFPEGTTIHKEALEKGNNYASRHKRPQFESVLLPRTTGMAAVLSAMKDARPEIYDLTMCFDGYSGEVPTWNMGYGRNVDVGIPSMSKLFGGQSVNPCHIHMDKFDYEDVVGDVQGWLDDRWALKQERMKHFAKHQKFPDSVYSTTKGDYNGATLVHPTSGAEAVVKLWTLLIVCTVLFPVLFILFWPCFICVIAYSLFDRLLTRVDITNGAWPYMKGLVSGVMLGDKNIEPPAIADLEEDSNGEQCVTGIKADEEKQ